MRKRSGRLPFGGEAIGIGIEGGGERKGGSGLLGGARGSPWLAAVCLRPLSGGHEEWEGDRENASKMFEAVESKEELERQTKGVFAKEGLGSSGEKELRGCGYIWWLAAPHPDKKSST